ncbi:hypothetical protein [Lysobacter gummosus]|uniref:hypothetical protein n=1 Tax=Lysobacter gummosus TaxID=262324 RepID=UPI003628D9CC
MPMSRAAAEKLPVSTARAKQVISRNRSIYPSDLCVIRINAIREAGLMTIEA